jgi:hypothetical protein
MGVAVRHCGGFVSLAELVIEVGEGGSMLESVSRMDVRQLPYF